MKEYAHILHAIADEQQVQYRLGEDWQDATAQEILELIVTDIDPDCLRIKPATININGFEVPEPMREAPGNGARYFYVDLGWGPATCNARRHAESYWHCKPFDLIALQSGICHPTEEAAELHAKALLSFTAKP